MSTPGVPPTPEERYRLLLRLAESINERLEIAAVLEAARLRLEPYVPVDAIVVITIDGGRLRRHAISAAKVPRVEGESARSAFGRVIASLQGDPSFLDEEMPLEGSAVAHIRDTRETLVYGDIPRDVRFPSASCRCRAASRDQRADLAGRDPAVRERLDAMTHGMMAHGSTLAEARRQAMAAMEGTVARQTFLLTYMDAFRVVGIFFLACIPLLLLFKRGRGGPVAVTAH